MVSAPDRVPLLVCSDLNWENEAVAAPQYPIFLGDRRGRLFPDRLEAKPRRCTPFQAKDRGSGAHSIGHSPLALGTSTQSVLARKPVQASQVNHARTFYLHWTASRRHPIF